MCVAIDLTAAFDTVSHDTLISKIVGSSLPPAITRWLSCYLRGRQAATSFRGTKSSTGIVRTGVPQGSKLSPSLFNYYIADMPRPTPPVKRVCYADDITVWATGPKIPQLESMINKSIASYAAPIWSTNTSDSSFKKIQTVQNAALRTATGAHKMASIDHLHQESLTLRVKDHLDMLSVQYLVNCLEEDHVSHCITSQDQYP